MTDAKVAAVVDDVPDLEVPKEEDHVHGPDCNHDHENPSSEEQQQAGPQKNDFDLLELNGTKDKTTDPLVKVGTLDNPPFFIGS